MNLMFIFEGVNRLATMFMWPILLFLLSVKIMTMGVIYLISNIIYAIVSYYSGKIADKHGHKKIITFGSIGHAISIIGRSLTKSIFMMTTFQSFGGLFGGIWLIPFMSNFYKKSHKDTINHIMNREVYLHLGKVLMCFVLLLFLVLYTPVTAFIFALIIAGLTTFGLTLMD